MFNGRIVGLAPREVKFYMLSFNDFPMINMCDVTNKCKRSSAHDNEFVFEIMTMSFDLYFEGEKGVSH
jgi:hypothetical protein